MIRNQYHETEFKQWPASESHCSVDLKIISLPLQACALFSAHSSPPQGLCVQNPNELSLSSNCPLKSIIIFPPLNLRVLINVGKVICQVCFTCGFFRLKDWQLQLCQKGRCCILIPWRRLQLCWLKKTSAFDLELLDIDPSLTVEL